MDKEKERRLILRKKKRLTSRLHTLAQKPNHTLEHSLKIAFRVVEITRQLYMIKMYEHIRDNLRSS
jgi:hypothetical protein